MNKKTFLHSFKSSLPVMAGYIVLGMGFGILMRSHGYGWYWSLLMSALVYAGSMQYVAVDLLATGASLLTFGIMTLVVNARHLFYGLAVLGKYKNIGKAKPYAIFALTDETFSIVCDDNIPDGVNEKPYIVTLSVLNQLYWVTGSLLGGIVGAAFSFNSAGIEFSMTALFTVSLIERWEKSDNHFPAIIGAVVSVLCIWIFGAGNFLIPAMIAITVILLLENPVRKVVGANAR